MATETKTADKTAEKKSPAAAKPEPVEKTSKEKPEPAEKTAAAKPTTAKPGAKKKEKKNVPYAVGHVQATFNNTIITITEPNGNVLCWGSAGAQGFKGSKKSTPFAAEIAASNCGKKATDMGVRTMDVLVRGPGSGREAAIRALQGVGIRINSIKDVTPIPHNGCRPKKRRRV